MKTSIVRPTQVRAGSKASFSRRTVSRGIKTLLLSVVSGFMLSVSAVSVQAEPELPLLRSGSFR